MNVRGLSVLYCVLIHTCYRVNTNIKDVEHNFESVVVYTKIALILHATDHAYRYTSQRFQDAMS